MEQQQQRFYAKQFYFTYSQCGELTAKETYDALVAKFAEKERLIVEYIVGHEKHQDGGNHVHCWIKLDKRYNLRLPARWLDINGVHGNYQSVRDTQQVKRYCTKDGNYIADPPYNPKKDHWSEVAELAEQGNLEGAIAKIRSSGTNSSRDFIIHHTAIMNALTRLAPPVALNGTRPLDDFGSLFQWDRTKTLILCGPTNRGKTTLAKSLMPHGLFVSHMDQLRNFNGHEGVIFDDMSFKHLPREGQICVLDTHENRAIHVRYGIATLKAGTPRIITTNRSPDDILNIYDGAIARRTLCITWWGHDKDPNWEMYDTNLHSSHIFNLPYDQ